MLGGQPHADESSGWVQPVACDSFMCSATTGLHDRNKTVTYRTCAAVVDSQTCLQRLHSLGTTHHTCFNAGCTRVGQGRKQVCAVSHIYTAVCMQHKWLSPACCMLSLQGVALVISVSYSAYLERAKRAGQLLLPVDSSLVSCGRAAKGALH